MDVKWNWNCQNKRGLLNFDKASYLVLQSSVLTKKEKTTRMEVAAWWWPLDCHHLKVLLQNIEHLKCESKYVTIRWLLSRATKYCYYSWSRCNAWVESSNATGILKDSSRVDIRITFQQIKFNKVSTERKQRGHRQENTKEQQLITVWTIWYVMKWIHSSAGRI